MENLNSIINYIPDKRTVSACGLYCGACNIYLATLGNDMEKLLQYAIVLNQPLADTYCDGCGADRKSAHCSQKCYFFKCTRNKGIEYCGACDDFPCKELKKFQSGMPHRVEVVESQSLLHEIGYENWLSAMLDTFSCPVCKTSNNAYDITCRKCSHEPGCEFVLRNRKLLDDYLQDDDTLV